MIYDDTQGGAFLDAVAAFEAAVRDQHGARSEQGFQQMHRAFSDARPHELAEGGPRLADLLPEVPDGARGLISVVVGACVERGADAARCAPNVFDGLGTALAGSAEFCERWAATGGGDVPAPQMQFMDDAVIERVGEDPAGHWCALPPIERACVTLLSHAAVRAALGADRRAELFRSVRALEETSGHDFKCLAYALLVLDDEPVIALHRPTGTGYALRMTGIGDNFQLHTLLADVLVGGGHVPGHVPSAQEAAVCRDQPGQVDTVGSFNLVGPDGQWVWNEGTPSDIPVVDGVRLLVLDPPPYRRMWPAGRFFPHMTGDLTLERVLAPEEAGAWLARCKPAA
ncbi:hypothetical protein ABZ202_19105 [Streptomyces sp. NPDC006186]|uniref:hypothetical protein n=1 Tax=Streptomyces sp. NPDC006186 TaxID=3155248 RepID=UPI00339E19F2